MALSEDDLMEAAEVFRLLGDATRLRVLLACLDEPLSVSQIADKAGASVSLVSHHLRLLKGGRLVRARRKGRQIFYSAAGVHVRSLLTDCVKHAGKAAENP